MAAFRLPIGCIKEIERLCSAFLLSGPDLNGRKVKIAWKDVCKMKQEGGWVMRSLREINLVSCQKLIWRILSSNSVWVNWIKIYLIRKGSLWTVKENTQLGSWMWRKILECRDIAKSLYRVDIRNGRKTSFWHEACSPLGCLQDMLREGNYIDMGIPINANADVSRKHRRRHHRVHILNKVEDEIARYKANLVNEEDVSL